MTIRRSKSKRRRKKKTGSATDRYLLALIGLAVVVLGVFSWFVVRDRLQRRPGPDFGDRLIELAEGRGAVREDVVADAEIRKVDGVFVRTWRIEVPSQTARAALAKDIAVETEAWRGSLTSEHFKATDITRMRIGLGLEAFDLQLVVTPEPPRYAQEIATATPRPRTPTATPMPQPAPGARGRLAILLDDGGQNRDLVKAAARLPVQVGVSVLPFLPHSADVARAMHRSGHEVWLHLPMEPEPSSGGKPGPGVVLVSMTDGEVRTAVHSAINNVPHAVGMNNHMGSKATADLRTMTWVMQELKARGLSFIDSRTTRKTVAEEAARAQGVPTGRRHVFLDNERNPEAIRRQLAEAVQRCRMEGEIIAVGHMVEVTVGVLQQELPKLKKRGADLVPPSKLVR